jgi:hypothetical protein
VHRAGKVVRALLNAWVFPRSDHHSIVIGLARKNVSRPRSGGRK